jgi:hypothetical protein
VTLIPGKDPDVPRVVGTTPGAPSVVSVKAQDVAITLDEKHPLIMKDQVITIETVRTRSSP